MTLPIPSSNTTSPDAPKRPRRSWTPAEQAAHLTDFAASGLSATAFCRRLGIRRATLARWRQRAAVSTPIPRREARPRALAAGFAAVAVVPEAVGVPPSASPPALTLVLRAPTGVEAECAGLDVVGAAALLRVVLAPAEAVAG